MPHRSRLASLMIDCRTDDLDAAARFWSAALGFPVATSDGRYAELDTPAGQPRVVVQRVEHESRVHLDIETDDTGAERARLEAAGARVHEPRAGGWYVMEAPTGHRFCIVHPARVDFPADAAEHD
jgi:catechol 2,3-dioxygenase-like lactoylglutathione lyase family enzyme